MLSIRRSSQSNGRATSRRLVSLVQRAGGKHVEGIEALLAVLDRKLRGLGTALDGSRGNQRQSGQCRLASAEPQQCGHSGRRCVTRPAAQGATHSGRGQCRRVQSLRRRELPVSEMEQRFQSFGISRGKR